MMRHRFVALLMLSAVTALPSPVAAALVPAAVDSTLIAALFRRSGKVRLVPLSAERALARTHLPELLGLSRATGERPDGRVRAAEIPLGSHVQQTSFVPLIPFAAKRNGVLRGYRIGWWPSEPRGRRKAKSATPLPDGFIEVHASDTAAAVSEQFRLGDFLTHDQRAVWPKYLVLKPDLLDKLELMSAELRRRGLPSKLRVMSGFRTPQYNARGVGRRGGRAKDSRHMYGDASDVFVDADDDGMMDDLDGDGRRTTADAGVLLDVGETVEAAHPELVGGLSAYKATSAHGPFVHVDVRGMRARW